MKVIYLIPGYGENINSDRYKDVNDTFNIFKFRVCPVNISWKYKTMSDYVEEFLSQIVSKNTDFDIFGFSFGAMIALISTKHVKPNNLILSSLSPYFKEDLPLLKKSYWSLNGKKRMADFTNYKFEDISQNNKSNTYVIYGEKEDKLVQKRSIQANKILKKSNIYPVKRGKHDVQGNEYIKILNKILLNIK